MLVSEKKLPDDFWFHTGHDLFGFGLLISSSMALVTH